MHKNVWPHLSSTHSSSLFSSYGRVMLFSVFANALACISATRCSSGVVTSPSGIGVNPGTESCIRHTEIVPKQNLNTPRAHCVAIRLRPTPIKVDGSLLRAC